MKNDFKNIDSSEIILWKSKPKKVQLEIGRGFKIYSGVIDVIWRLLILIVLGLLVYATIKDRANLNLLILGILTLIFLIGVNMVSNYDERQRFKRTSYTLTDRKLVIRNWSLLSGERATVIQLNQISKTYLIGVTKDVGTILIYERTGEKGVKDLLTGRRFEVPSIQYIENPLNVKKLIDNQRNGKV